MRITYIKLGSGTASISTGLFSANNNRLNFKTVLYIIAEKKIMCPSSNGEVHQKLGPRRQSDDDLAVLAVRNLVADLCNQNGSGHGGSAIGMAAIGVALWKYTMRYSPADPTWFDRDRFVLSNG